MIETRPAAPATTTTTIAPTPRVQIALCYVAFILVGVVDGAVGVLLPSLQAFYGVSKATVSLLFLASTAGYAIAAFGSGPLTEWIGRRLLAFGALAIGVATAVISRTPPFAVVLVAALISGFGIATLDAGLNAFFAGLPRSTALLNYLHAFFGVGAFLGPFIAATLLASGRPWHEVYLIWAALAAAVLVGLLRFFPGTARPGAETAATDAAGGNILAATLRLRVVWFAALFLLFYVGAEVTLGNWSYSYLTELHRQPLLPAGWAVSGYWLGLTAGRLTLAQLAARFGQSERRLVQACIGGFVAGLLLLWIAPVAAMPALFLAGFALGPIFPTVIALVPSLVPGRLVPGAVGFLASLGSMGAALFPWLAGVLAQGAGLGVLMPYLAALAVVMTVWWLAVGVRE